MKKFLFITTLLVLSFTLTACGNTEEDSLNTVKSELEGIGYVFEQRDEDARTYYNNKAVNEEYDVDLDLIDLYIGYVNETEGWLELLVFESNDQADDFVEATSESGYIVYKEGNVVFITYSSDAMSPFIEESTKSSD